MEFRRETGAGVSFESAVLEWEEKARRSVLADVKQLTRDAHANIVLITPIDTGRAKSSWNIAPGANPDLSVTPPLAVRPQFGIIAVEKGASPLTRGQAITAGFGQHQQLEALTEPVATISNDLDYILALEKGSSPQASAGAMFTNNVFNALDEAQRLGYTARLR